MGFIVIHPNDNVKVNLENGHKYARCNIKKGEPVIKYGFPIGFASADIAQDEHVHTHNLKTGLSGVNEYEYTPQLTERTKEKAPDIHAFVRKTEI